MGGQAMFWFPKGRSVEFGLRFLSYSSKASGSLMMLKLRRILRKRPVTNRPARKRIAQAIFPTLLRYPWCSHEAPIGTSAQ